MNITTTKIQTNLPSYFMEWTPTECHAIETVLFISNNIAYKPRKGLSIQKYHGLESTFIEIFNPKQSNIILDVVYRHHTMDLNEFNDKYLNKLLKAFTRKRRLIKI